MSEDKARVPGKKRKKWPWAAGLLLALILFLIFGPLRNRDTRDLTVREASPGRGSLTLTVVGTGHLEYDESREIGIASGLKVAEVFVKAGDRVKAGDTLASFDPLSVDLAIASILDEIGGYDLLIGQGRGDESQVVRAPAAGRVKAIYAVRNELAAALYQEHKSLLILSLDGRMAVEFESEQDLDLLQKVNVELENGSIKEGTIRQKDGRFYTVTLTDNGPKPDEEVKLSTREGDFLGSGNLVIHKALPVIAAQGRVSGLHVSENEYVGAGRALLTLDNLPAASSYDKLLADRQESQEALDRLLLLKESPVLLADSDGVIQSLFLTAGEETGSTASASLPQTAGQESPAYTLVPGDHYLLSIQIDELDILSIARGQKAGITFDAIPGREFTGRIDEKAPDFQDSGGIAKYLVRVLIDADDDMRIGMSVTATIVVDEKEDILLLPIVALQESGGRVYVYTELDESTGGLGGEREVVTGLSDGSRAEILEGLDEGTTVYYRLAGADNSFPFTPPGQRPAGNDGPGGEPSDG